MRENIPSVALSHDESGQASVFWTLGASKGVGERLERKDVKEIERERARNFEEILPSVALSNWSDHASVFWTHGAPKGVSERLGKNK